MGLEWYSHAQLGKNLEAMDLILVRNGSTEVYQDPDSQKSILEKQNPLSDPTGSMDTLRLKFTVANT